MSRIQNPFINRVPETDDDTQAESSDLDALLGGRADTPEDLDLLLGGRVDTTSNTNAADIDALGGRVENAPVSTAPKAPAPLPGDPKGEAAPDLEVSNLLKTRTALETEYRSIAGMPEGPRRSQMENNFMDRWSEQVRRERLYELGETTIVNGRKLKDDPIYREGGWNSLRWVDETVAGLFGTAEMYGAQLVGNEKKAADIKTALDNISEYNRLMDEYSVLGDTAGRTMGAVNTSLLRTTSEAMMSGGANAFLGVAGLESMNTFLHKMSEKAPEDSESVSPVRRWANATGHAIADFVTIAAGGAAAKHLGVANAEILAPRIGKTLSQMTTLAGVKDVLVAGGVNALEGGSSALGHDLVDLASGMNPDVADGMLDRVLQAASLEGLVGSAVEVGGRTMTLDPRSLHVKSTLDGWMQRLKKQKTPPPLAQTAPTTENVIAPSGAPIKRTDIDAQLNALAELEAELMAQKAKGPAPEYHQAIDERAELIKFHEEELARIEKQIADTHPTAAGKKEVIAADLSAAGKTPGAIDPNSIFTNLTNRKRITQELLDELKGKQRTAQDAVKAWESEFEKVHAEEIKYIEQEILNLTSLEARQVKLDSLEGQQTGAKPATEGEPTTAPVTPAETEPITQPTVKSPADELVAAAERRRTHDAEKVRRILDIESVPPLQRRGLEEQYNNALGSGLVDRADSLAKSAIGGKVLNAEESAAVHIAQEETVARIADNLKRAQKPDLSDAEYDVINRQVDLDVERLGYLTEGYIKTGRESSLALNVRRNYWENAFSEERAITKGTRNKKAPLLREDTEALVKVAQKVKAAAEDLEIAREAYGRGTPEFDRADLEYAKAITDYNATIENMKPASLLTKFYDGINTVSMAGTLSGDLVALGRQGRIDLTNAPRQTLKNAKKFFKQFTEKDIEMGHFLSNRSIKEHPMFPEVMRLSQGMNGSGFKLMDAMTPYTEMEGGLAQRMRDNMGSVMQKLPIQRFELAQKTWLNEHRFDVILEGLRSVKNTVDNPTDADFQKVIGEAMLASGHTGGAGFGVGNRLIGAPRWFLSRLLYPPKAMSWVAKGGWDAIRGQKSVERQLARKVVRSMAGSYVFGAALHGLAALTYGDDQVEFGYNPLDYKNFMVLKLPHAEVDVSGGMATMIALMGATAEGAYNMSQGGTLEEGLDPAQAIGGRIASRALFIPRTVMWIANNGYEPFQNDPTPAAEYAARNFTFLSWQNISKAAKEEGLPAAVGTALAEMFGFSTHERKK